MSVAVRIQTTVLSGHRIEVAAPEFPEGEAVQVIVKPAASESSTPEDRTTFNRLIAEWRESRGPTSKIETLAMHSAYQKIIGMGERAIPLILAEMEQRPGHWDWALRAITREDPVPKGSRGKIKETAEHWVRWGRERGYQSGA